MVESSTEGGQNILARGTKQRNLLVTGIFPPQLGSPATFMARLAESLAQQHRYEVTVVCATDDPTGQADQSRPYTVRRLFRRNSPQSKLQVRAVLAKDLLTHIGL